MLSSAEAKKLYFLTAEDMKSVPRETFYSGFGTGRAAYYFREADLKAAAVAKYGEEGLNKKLAARRKREDNKRKREEEDKENEITMQAELQKNNPGLAKKEAAKKQRMEQKATAILQRNKQIVGDPWNLTITAPESVAGTEAMLRIKQLPPDGWPGDSQIDCFDLQSPAYSFGNIHGFKGRSSEADAEMVFETKWKVCGRRFTGTLRVQVKPSDNNKTPKKNVSTDGDQAESCKQPEEELLMITGKFDCGVNDGVRRWSFKGYR